MSKSSTIVTTTTTLSKALKDISSEASRAGGRLPSHQAMLNTLARGIAGPKHDWGYLTGAEGAVIQAGLPPARLADLHNAVSAEAAPQKQGLPANGALVKGDPSKPHLEVTAKIAKLYDPAMAAYLAAQYQDGLIALYEEFSAAPEHGAAVQCMFQPTALLRGDDESIFVPKLLWGHGPDFIDRTARAYFAASASEEVNDLVNTAIVNWNQDAICQTFHAYYLPHAVIVTPDYPAYAFESITGSGADMEEKEDRQIILDGTFQVFIDSSRSPSEQVEARARAEDLLNRVMRFLKARDARLSNIIVA